ncbi:cytochrome d ubiquinol oxidase, subunit I [Enterococcus sp. AZ048]
MDIVTLARFQFAMTTVFHFFFRAVLNWDGISCCHYGNIIC